MKEKILRILGGIICVSMICTHFSQFTVEASGVKDMLSTKPAKNGKSATKSENSPLRIVSDEMTCDQKTNICVAKGNAFAEQLNVPDSEKKTISAERFIAHFKRKDGGEGNSGEKRRKSLFAKKPKNEKSHSGEDDHHSSKTSLEKLEAFGNVVMTDPQSIIRSDEAVYYAETEMVDLAGNVSLTQDKNQLTGTHGHANLKDGTYKITNEEGRVEALFYQKNAE